MFLLASILKSALPSFILLGILAIALAWAIREMTLRKASQLQCTTLSLPDQSAFIDNQDTQQEVLEDRLRSLWSAYYQTLVALSAGIWSIGNILAVNSLTKTLSNLAAARGNLSDLFLLSPLELAVAIAVLGSLSATVVVLCHILAYPIFKTIGKLGWSQRELIESVIWRQMSGVSALSGLLPGVLTLLCYVSYLFKTEAGIEINFLPPGESPWVVNPLVGITLIGLGYGGTKGVNWLSAKALKVLPQALLMGELRDRIFAMAKQVGVQLKQVYILPARQIRIANAFAGRGNQILLTDYLVENLSQREVDAVVAHELTHLQHSHPGLWLILSISAPILTMVIVQRFMGSSPASWLWAVLAGIAPLYCLRFVSHHFEHTADRQAAMLTQDPAAMITALARLTQLNPISSKKDSQKQSFLTHPSLQKRANAIAKTHNIQPQQIQQLITQAETPVLRSEQYPLPLGLIEQDLVFSSADKVLFKFWQQFAMIAATTLPAIAVAAFTPSGLEPWGESFLHLIGLLIAVCCLFASSNIVPMWGLRWLRQQMSQKLIKAGLKPQVAGGTFVALSLDQSPHLYEDLWFWDIGFLSIWGDCLCYLGDQVQFCLKPKHITAIRVGRGEPNWQKAPSLYITWQDFENNASGTLRIQINDVSSRQQISSATHRWQQNLETWHKQTSRARVPARLQTLGTPSFGMITCMKPNDVDSLRRFLALLMTTWFAGGAVCVLLQIDIESLQYVMQVGLIGTIAQALPEWLSQSDRT
jgi:Zn-dependent protease with chaperone function